jgi:hypothetical protein
METTMTRSGRSLSRSQGADVDNDVGAPGRVLGIWAHPDDETSPMAFTQTQSSTRPVVRNGVTGSVASPSSIPPFG